MGKRMIGGSLEKVKPSLALGKLNAEEQALFYEVSKYAAQVIVVVVVVGWAAVLLDDITLLVVGTPQWGPEYIRTGHPGLALSWLRFSCQLGEHYQVG